MKIRILTEADCRSLLTMADAIELQAEAFATLAAGESVEGLRSYAESEHPPGVAIFNPCFLKGGRGYGVKVVSDFYDNDEVTVPRMTATMTLMDGATGVPHTFMEAGYLTDLRTGAGTGLAAKHLARPDTTELAVIGAGRVAQYQILALTAVLPITKIRISTRTRTRAERLVTTLRGEVAADLEIVDDPAAALRGAGAVVAATTSKSPVVPGEHVEPGAFVVGAGAYAPTSRELDSETIRRAARCVIDSRADCLEDAGDYVIPAQEGVIALADVAEIAEVVSGAVPGRTADDQIFVYKSIGVPIQDLVTGQAIAERARRAGAGTEMELNP
jgi:ornithine cyclodeaminase/alanine dehydrogenase-like protein (mu-crystallin family)